MFFALDDIFRPVLFFDETENLPDHTRPLVFRVLSSQKLYFLTQHICIPGQKPLVFLFTVYI